MEQIVYTVPQVAEMFQVSICTIQRRIKDGTIPREKWCGKTLIPAWWIEKARTEKGGQ